MDEHPLLENEVVVDLMRNVAAEVLWTATALPLMAKLASKLDGPAKASVEHLMTPFKEMLEDSEKLVEKHNDLFVALAIRTQEEKRREAERN